MMSSWKAEGVLQRFLKDSQGWRGLPLIRNFQLCRLLNAAASTLQELLQENRNSLFDVSRLLLRSLSVREIAPFLAFKERVSLPEEMS
jgi:hypothetical protein